MKVALLNRAALTLGAASLALAPTTAEARHTRHHVVHHPRHDADHGHCLRFNKTTGAIAGAAGGAVLGKVIFGGPVAIVAGAAAGGIAGHKLARNGRKRCR